MSRRWSPTRLRRAAGLVAAGVAVVLMVSGCTVSPSTTVTSGSVDSSVAAGLESFYTQAVTWKNCTENDNFQCATVTVPLDYAHPTNGETISIAVNVHRASKTSKGVLFLNPGGPGGSGFNYTLKSLTYLFSDDLIENYDIVGFDPRGVGESTAVKCFDSNADKDEFVYGVIDGTPGSAQYVAAAKQRMTSFAKNCRRLSGDLLDHVDTISAAKDIDVLRSALGSSTLNYFGFSYGTLLGTTYAGLFPNRVNRFVLDGAEDPTLSISDLSYGQMVGFDGAIRAYVANCLTTSTCPLSGSQSAAVTELIDLVSSLNSSPIKNSDGRTLGSTNMLQVIVDCMYNTQYQSALSTIIADVQAGSAKSAFTLLDRFNSRASDGSYEDNSVEAFYAVMCLDYPRRTSAADIAEDGKRYTAGSDILGTFYADGTAMCDGWTADPVREPAAISAEGSGPILVVGTTGDPATPYSWAVALSTQLSNARLLTVDAYQHTSYSSSASSCIVSAVDGFLLEGALPAAGTTCDP